MDSSLPGFSVHGDSSGKKTGVGCHALLQRIFPTQGWNPGLPHCRQLYRIREDNTSKWQFFFLISVSSWGTPLLSFFTFPICFKWILTIAWSKLISSATSHVVEEDQLWWWLSVGQGSQSPLQNFLNNHCTVHSLAVPRPNALLMLRVVSEALWPTLN